MPARFIIKGLIPATEASSGKIKKCCRRHAHIPSFLFTNESSEPGSYDVILMDVMMPVMDGLTATKTIRSLERQDAKTIPIIAMTANAFREDAEKCMEAGMNAHLAKPLDDKTIKQTICEELRSSRDR